MSGLRYGLAIIAGGVLSLAMFLLMQALIGGQDGARLEEREATPILSFLREKRQEQVEPRKRKPPEPEKPPEPLPKPKPLPQAKAETIIKPQLDMPVNVPLTTGLGGIPYLGPMGAGEMDRDIIMLSRIPPQYPYSARRRKIEGWVKLSFIVSQSGETQDIRVVEAKPAGVFDQAAIRAARQWRFKPRIEYGKAVAAQVEQTLEFKLSK